MQTPDFVQRTDTGKSGLALRANAPRVLEVHLIWEDLVIDTRHYAPGSEAITIGEAMGWKWRCLGIDMGWMRPSFRHLPTIALPLWAEVEHTARCDFFTPSEFLDGDERVEIVRWEDDHAVLDVPEGWTVETGGHGRAWSFVDTRSTPVPADDVIRLRRGDLSLILGRVRAPLGMIARPDLGPDRRFAGVFSAVAAAGLLFGIAIASQPPTPTNEVVEIPEQVMSLVYQAPEPPPPVEKPPEPAKPKSKGDEGSVGEPDGDQPEAAARKSENESVVQRSGLIDAFASSDFGDMFTDGGLSTGLADSISGLAGPKGTRIGNGGMGRIGNGPGGGGTAEGTYIGGTCTGDLEKCGTGTLPEMEKPVSAVPQVRDALIIGGLDRAQIDDVIKRHMASIRYCYQRQLQQDPGLGGKLVVKFTIARDGSVSQAGAKMSTIQGSAVDDCVVGRFLKMQFPKPKGGIVVVSYPFLFAPG
ncbi:MAG: AgmX/PglI C-terminal domain-containing protein [Proteobacteria bacterium]|nr:AgmX/PglI C-terminal domain-containing protein [Pseudomonadota bacterium]